MTAASTLALVVLALGGFGLVLLAALSVLPATAAKARDLWPAMASELVIGAVALGFVLPGGGILAAGVVLLAARCAWEGTTVAAGPAAGPTAALVQGAAVAAASGLAHLFGLPGLLGGIGLAAASLAGLGLAGRIDRGSALVAFVFPSLPLVAFAAVAALGEGRSLLFLAFLLVETMDSFAVLGGRLFGRRKVFPRLSPRKTVEGLASGAAALAIVAAVLGTVVMGWSPGRIAFVAAVAAVATVAGDLTASAVKRRAGVKDYPVVHPVQGGVLDIVDAWIVTAPALALALALV